MRLEAEGRRTALFWLLCFAVLAGCLLSGAWNLATPAEDAFYDAASDNLMATDLEYMRSYGLDGPVPRYYRIGDVTPEGETLENTRLVLARVHSGAGMPQQAYHYYTSNLCVQRYAYALAGLLPLGMPALLGGLRAGATLLFAACMAGLLVWVRRVACGKTAVAMLAVLGLASPMLNSFAGNLYWLPYTWFVPMLGAAYMARRWERSLDAPGFDAKRWSMGAFFMAFGTCLFKQLHCFEFVSCVMVAMMMPYVMMLAGRVPLKQWRRWLAALVWPAVGALASFAAAVGIKLLVLGSTAYVSELQGGQSALAELVLNILRRTGGAAEEAALQAAGYQTGLPAVLHQMLKKPPLAVRGVLDVSFYAVVVLLAAVTVYVWVLHRTGRLAGQRRLCALLAGAWVGLAGPLSWFVLARLHVVDHIMIDGGAWYIPFAIVAPSALIYFFGLCVTGLAQGPAEEKVNNDKGGPV